MDSSRLFNVGSSFIGLYLLVMLLIFNQLGIWFDLDIDQLGSIVAVIGLMVILSSELVNQILIWVFIKFWGGYESLGIQGEIEKEYNLNREKIASTYNRLTRRISNGIVSDAIDPKFDVSASLDFVRRHQQVLMTRRFLQSCIALLLASNIIVILFHIDNALILTSMIFSFSALVLLYWLINILYNYSNNELLEYEKDWLGLSIKNFVITQNAD